METYYREYDQYRHFLTNGSHNGTLKSQEVNKSIDQWNAVEKMMIGNGGQSKRPCKHQLPRSKFVLITGS